MLISVIPLPEKFQKECSLGEKGGFCGCQVENTQKENLSRKKLVHCRVKSRA